MTKDENSKEIIMKELIINNIGDNQSKEFTILFLFKISDKIYIITHLVNNKEEDEQNNYSIFGIYNIIYIEKDNKFTMELFQTIIQIIFLLIMGGSFIFFI